MKTSKGAFRFFICFSILFLFVFAGYSQDKFPGVIWEKTDKSESLGYSSDKLELAKQYSEGIKTAAVVIIVDGVILKEWGDVEVKFMTHSVRKSFLGALYGNYVRKGIIDLDKTLKDLGVDDDPPLTDDEKRATIRDCLKARSGIYHSALYESAGMKALKPKRHTEKAGIHWYYNNWDFNVAGTLFEKLTGKKIFQALKEDIADPIQMESFDIKDGWYVTGDESIHPAYPFKITARDFARFGYLMLKKGNWNGKQIIPKDWVEESTRYHSDATLYGSDGYGYMWWVSRNCNKYPHLPNVNLPEGTYSARGAGGHYILIIPDYNMVIVHRVNTFERGNSVSGSEMGKLTQMILDAKM